MGHDEYNTCDFNPRPREEGDLVIFAIQNLIKNFNPRPREEGDMFYKWDKVEIQDFNPRPREEGDLYCSIPYSLAIYISIHALVKRATSISDFVKYTV